MSSHPHHDDFGGLHRDLAATGKVMDRRDLFRLAARLGVGVSALSVLGCGGSTAASPSGSNSSSGGGSASTCSRVPEETAGLGRYSLYTSGVTNQNYLRGVQEADSSGKVTFTSIYPGCYAGRWPHIHFEVYPGLASATNVANKTATSQIALTRDASELVYAQSGYSGSTQNLSQVSLASDNVFSDGSALEIATMTGSVAAGFTAALTVAI